MDNQRWVSDNDFRQIPQLFDGVGITHTPGSPTPSCTRATTGACARPRAVEAPLNLTLLHAAWNPAPGHGARRLRVLPRPGAERRLHRVRGQLVSRARRARRGRRSRASRPSTSSTPPRPRSSARLPAAIRASTRATGALGGGAATDRWTLRYDYEVKGSNDGALRAADAAHRFLRLQRLDAALLQHAARGAARPLAHRRACGSGPFVFYGEAHRFRSDFGDLDFGREIDLGVTWLAHENAHGAPAERALRPGTAHARRSRESRKTWLTAHLHSTDDHPLEAPTSTTCKRAKQMLENPGLAAKLSSMLGSPVEKGMKMLPAAVAEGRAQGDRGGAHEGARCRGAHARRAAGAATRATACTR